MTLFITIIVVALAVFHTLTWYFYDKRSLQINPEIDKFQKCIEGNWKNLLLTAKVTPSNELATSIWLNCGLDKEFDLSFIQKRIQTVRAINVLTTNELFEKKVIGYDLKDDYFINRPMFEIASSKKMIEKDEEAVVNSLTKIIKITNHLKNNKSSLDASPDNNIIAEDIEILNKYFD